jgi:hypothetical protein
MFTDEMRKEFAQNGYIIVPNVLSKEQLNELNSIYDNHVTEGNDTLSAARTDQQIRFFMGNREKCKTTDRFGNTYTGRRFWGKAYRDLIDNETMLPIIEEVLGDPSWGHAPAHLPQSLRSQFRLDHDNIHYKPGRKPSDGPDVGGSLHGGPGNCILFTEKLVHGTIPWSGKNERRTLFYKYVPYGMHHGDVAYDVNDPELTVRQRRIVEFSAYWFNEPREDKDYSDNPSLTELHPEARIESSPTPLQPGMAPPNLRFSEETKKKLSH